METLTHQAVGERRLAGVSRSARQSGAGVTVAFHGEQGRAAAFRRLTYPGGAGGAPDTDLDGDTGDGQDQGRQRDRRPGGGAAAPLHSDLGLAVVTTGSPASRPERQHPFAGQIQAGAETARAEECPRRHRRERARSRPAPPRPRPQAKPQPDAQRGPRRRGVPRFTRTCRAWARAGVGPWIARQQGFPPSRARENPIAEWPPPFHCPSRSRRGAGAGPARLQRTVPIDSRGGSRVSAMAAASPIHGAPAKTAGASLLAIPLRKRPAARPCPRPRRKCRRNRADVRGRGGVPGEKIPLGRPTRLFARHKADAGQATNPLVQSAVPAEAANLGIVWRKAGIAGYPAEMSRLPTILKKQCCSRRSFRAPAFSSNIPASFRDLVAAPSGRAAAASSPVALHRAVRPPGAKRRPSAAGLSFT